MSQTNPLFTVIAKFYNVIKEAKEKNKAVHLALYGGGFVVLFWIWKMTQSKKPYKLEKYSTNALASPTELDFYDVAIIGAGPAGATCGYYLAKKGRKVVVFDKQKFPRDKYCGDAVTTLAQKHLKEMGALQQLEEEGKVHWSQSGGFVSPNGYSFIGDSAKEMKRGKEGVVVAIKRVDMDEKIARACQKSGADLRENHNVVDATFHKAEGYWKVKCEVNDTKEIAYFKARVLISADGAPSKFAVQKNFVKTQPEGVCSRAYITGKHSFKSDGVIFYPPKLLPGYCAILRHAKDELGFCTYIIPGGPAKNEDLLNLHEDIMKNDPYVSNALSGDIKVERMKGASLRLGGIPKSYDDNFLIIGDAAGFIDPLTGEGIQYAMESAKYAADVVVDALEAGNLNKSFLKRYHDKWYSDWGREFYWSMKVSLFLYRFPILLDAAASLIGKRGAQFLADWANVMTGAGSKLWVLRPDVGPILFLEALGIAIRRALGYEHK